MNAFIGIKPGSNSITMIANSRCKHPTLDWTLIYGEKIGIVSDYISHSNPFWPDLPSTKKNNTPAKSMRQHLSPQYEERYSLLTV